MLKFPGEVFFNKSNKRAFTSANNTFSLERITFTNITGTMDFGYHYELAADIGYSRKFTDHLSGGLTLRYIYSDVAPRQNTADGTESGIGKSVAADLSIYYQKPFVIGAKDALWAIGFKSN